MCCADVGRDDVGLGAVAAAVVDADPNIDSCPRVGVRDGCCCCGGLVGVDGLWLEREKSGVGAAAVVVD